MLLGLQNSWHTNWYQGNLAAPIGSTKRVVHHCKWNVGFGIWARNEWEVNVGREERGKLLISQPSLIHLFYFKDPPDPPVVGHILWMQTIHLWQLLSVTGDERVNWAFVTFLSKCNTFFLKRFFSDTLLHFQTGPFVHWSTFHFPLHKENSLIQCIGWLLSRWLGQQRPQVIDRPVPGKFSSWRP